MAKGLTSLGLGKTKGIHAGLGQTDSFVCRPLSARGTEGVGCGSVPYID